MHFIIIGLKNALYNYINVKEKNMETFILSGIAVIFTIVGYDLFLSKSRRWGENQRFWR